MKRWTLRLFALSGVVVLGLIAIAQAQRSIVPSEDYPGANARPAAGRDQSAGQNRPEIVQISAVEPDRYSPGSTARIVSVQDRPAKRPDDVIRAESANDDVPAAPRDPFSARDSVASRDSSPARDRFPSRDRAASAAAAPERFAGVATAAELPANNDTPNNLRSGAKAAAPDDASIFSSGGSRKDPPREFDRRAAAAPATAFEDRDARPLTAASKSADGPSLGPALAAPNAISQPSSRAERDPFGHATPLPADNRAAANDTPAPPTNSIMKHGSNAFRQNALDNNASLDAPSLNEGTGRPGMKQLEGAQSPQLTIEKIAPPEVQVGKAAKFEIKVRNAGSVAAQGVEIHDELPKGTQLVSTHPNATQGSRGELVWSLGTINPGDQVVATLELMPIAEGEIGSVASVTFHADASARTLATKPQLAMQVSAPKQVMKGGDVTFTIRLSNPGSGAATGVVLAEKVPAGLKHPAGGELEFEVGTLKPGESRQVDLTMKAAEAGKIVNMLTARGEGNLKAEEKAEFDVIAPALSVAIAGPARRYLERQATYTVSVSNPGSAPAKDIQLTTQLPRGLKFVKANNSGQYDPSTHTVTWSLEELPATETGSVTLVALPIEVGEQKMHVQGKAQQGLTDEKDQPITVEGIAALAFDVKASDEAIEVGGETVYQIHVVNTGSKAASNVQIAALLPAELKATKAEGPSRETVEEHRVQFEPLARLAPKTDATFRIHAQALAAGDLRVRIQLMTDEMRQPVTKEESTRVYTDQ